MKQAYKLYGRVWWLCLKAQHFSRSLTLLQYTMMESQIVADHKQK